MNASNVDIFWGGLFSSLIFGHRVVIIILNPKLVLTVY